MRKKGVGWIWSRSQHYKYRHWSDHTVGSSERYVTSTEVLVSLILRGTIVAPCCRRDTLQRDLLLAFEGMRSPLGLGRSQLRGAEELLMPSPEKNTFFGHTDKV